MIPLTHHEIVERVGPFARRGRHVDLAATDRAARRIVFRRVERAGVGDGPVLSETLSLDDDERGAFRLTRTLSAAGQPDARLQTEGVDAAVLLDAVEAVPAERQIVDGGGVVIAMSHRLDASASSTEAGLMLTAASALVSGLTLTIEVPRMRGISADVEIVAAPGDAIALPEDLLAVLGWPWGRLQRLGDRWRSALRLRGGGAGMGRDAEAKFTRTAGHLAATLGEAPDCFHARWRTARWRVALRRSVPLLASVAMIGGAASASQLDLDQSSVLRMVIFQAPPLLLAWVFCMREMPRVEIPPLPRPAGVTRWREPRQDDAIATTASGVTG